jgi:hypothetical protein
MEKFTVVAQVRFEIEDLDEFVAQRQATACVLKYILNDPIADEYSAEYPVLATPYFIAGEVSILDKDGKVVAGFDPNDKSEDESENTEQEED